MSLRGETFGVSYGWNSFDESELLALINKGPPDVLRIDTAN